MHDRLTSPFSTWNIEPRTAEPGHGYVTRLVDGEGHASLRVYGNWIAVNGRNVVPEEMLALICELPISQERREMLVHSTPVERDGSYFLAGERFAKRDLSFVRRRWCPACLAEAAYHRTWWDILAIRRCPYHDSEIIDRDADGQTIKWWWPRFDVARSGLSLGGPRKPKTLRRGTFAAYALARMGFEAKVSAPLLDPLAITEVIDVCQLLGRLLSNPWSRAVPELTTRTVDLGYRAMNGDMAHLAEAISKWMRNKLSREEVNGTLFAAFGFAHRQARKLRSAVARDMVMSALQLARTHSLTGMKPSSNGSRLLSIAALSDELGKDRRGVAAMVNAMASTSERRGKRRILFAAVQAKQIEHEIENALSRSQVAERLGLPSWAIGHLVRSGFLFPVRSLGKGKGLHFATANVEAVLRKLQSLPSVTGKSRKFLTYWRAENLHPGDVAVSVLKGDLDVVHCDLRVFNFRGIGIAGRPDGGCGNGLRGEVSLVEAEAILNVTRQTVQWLAARGLLGPVERSAKLALLGRTEVEAFASRYRNVAEMAEPLHMNARRLVRQLVPMGVIPIVSHADGLSINTMIDVDAAIAALGLDSDPTAIDDEALVAFWTDLVKDARVRCPQFKFPDRLPSSGQRVWRGDRRGSVFFEFDPGTREVHYRLLGRRFLHDRKDSGRRRSVVVTRDAKVIIDRIS